MLIIDNNSVYEIDEECLKRRKVPTECDIIEKIDEIKKKTQDIKEPEGNKSYKKNRN